MAQLNSHGLPDQRTGHWNPGQTWAQYAAIAWLRWRMLLNISRRANSPGEIAGRVVLYLLLAGGASSLTFFAGTMGWLFAAHGELNRLWLVFWGIFGICQMLNINLGQPGTTFDPTDLLRFPLRTRTYIAIRLFFNLLSPANVMALLMSLAVAVGVTLAIPSLWLYALVACTVFAVTNVLFSRMIFAWIDRWLSTRRAREVFTAAIFLFSMGIQYANLTFNPGFSSGRHHKHNSTLTRQRVSDIKDRYDRAEPVLRLLPPQLVSNSLRAASEGRPLSFLVGTAGCAAYGALFLFVFALRMRTEFRGEAFSDTAAASTLPPPRRAPLTPSRLSIPAAGAPALPAAPVESGLLSGPLVALMQKEWTYMRRNTGLLYGLLAPLFLIVLFALRMGRNFTSPWMVPLAVAYSLLGVAPMSYNSFGLDGTGAQLYFMAPVPLRRVFIAKNILHFAIALVEVLVVLTVMTYVTSLPPISTLLGAVLWACGSLLLNTALGNRRSVTSPKKIDLSRMARKQASQTSALMSLGILLACVGYGAGVLALAALFAMPWISVLCFALLAAVGFAVYRKSLGSLQTFTMDHRDTLFEALGKA